MLRAVNAASLCGEKLKRFWKIRAERKKKTLNLSSNLLLTNTTRRTGSR